MWDGHLGTVTASQHPIQLNPGAQPVHAQPYRAGTHARAAEQEEIQKMLAQYFIEPATCEWASPIVLVPKPDGSIRFYVDYMRLNAITEPDTYPLPRMEEFIDSLGEAVVLRPWIVKSRTGKFRWTWWTAKNGIHFPFWGLPISAVSLWPKECSRQFPKGHRYHTFWY
jgi:hypothetical protein